MEKRGWLRQGCRAVDDGKGFACGESAANCPRDKPTVATHSCAVHTDLKIREIKFRDPCPIWVKALVAAYLAEEGFLRGSGLVQQAELGKYPIESYVYDTHEAATEAAAALQNSCSWDWTGTTTNWTH